MNEKLTPSVKTYIKALKAKLATVKEKKERYRTTLEKCKEQRDEKILCDTGMQRCKYMDECDLTDKNCLVKKQYNAELATLLKGRKNHELKRFATDWIH